MKVKGLCSRATVLSLSVAMLIGGAGLSIASTSAGASTKLKGTTLTFGVISTDTYPGGNTTDATTTISRWVKYTNSHGGDKGHPVRVIEMNDNDSAATAIQDAQTLIKTDHVIAIGDASQTATSFAKVVDKLKVPIISLSGELTGFTYVTDSNTFGNGGAPLAGIWAYAKLGAVTTNGQMAVVYGSEIAASAEVPELITPELAALGGKVVYVGETSEGQPNYTATCLAAQSAGATSIALFTISTSENQRIMDDCAAQHYFPEMLASGPTVGSGQLFTDTDIPIIVGNVSQIPWFVHNAATAVFQKVMGSYLSSASSDPDITADWVGLQLFAAAAAKIPLHAKPTVKAIYAGLYSFHGNTIGGLTTPTTYAKGKPSPGQCVYGWESNKGVLSVLNGAKPYCQPAS
jgi:branched-chain amino acid transport system substrate-binding protein